MPSAIPAKTKRPAKPAAKTAKAASKPAKAAPKKPAKAPKRPRSASAFEPRTIPERPQGKPDDPRLAAALAARERWHGRSGRPALKSATQAVAFARERRLVNLTVASALPNLVDPIVGRSCTPQERQGGQPAAVLQAWSKELAAAPDLLQLRLCFEQPTLVQAELWPSVAVLAAPLEEKARAGGVLSAEAEEALDLLDRKGVLATDRLRTLLGLSVKDFARIQAELEARLCVVARPDLDEEDMPITVLEPLGRWASRTVVGRRPDPAQAFTLLFAAAVRAGVVLYPEEAESLLPWTAPERERAIATSLEAGAHVTYAEGGGVAFVASPVPR